MLKLPSLQQLIKNFLAVIKRFPIEVVASAIGTLAAITLITKEDDWTYDQMQPVVRILLCSILGLTLFLSASVFTERQKISVKTSVLIKLLAIAVVVALYFLLDPINHTSNIFRYGFLFAAFHLLVSFAPFTHSQNVSAFWEYNKQLFLRILTSGLYSTVLFAGLCIAIVSTKVLFSLDIDEKIYGYLASFIYGIFNTIFFLAGVPDNWEHLETEQSYPKGLKIFTQFVLIPLAIIYLIILLSYEGKVILEWSLPKGVVASLVLGYAVYGILSILLVYPIRHTQENTWIKTFAKLFYALLIPLIILLGVAIWTRVSNYGITEPRYIIIVLSFWLSVITAYFLLNREQNIKVIPISLCIISLLIIWGPQSASSVSYRSQVGRLFNFFENHNSVKDGKLLPLDTVTRDNTGWEITTFLIDQYGIQSLQDYLSVEIDSITYAADTIKNEYNRGFARISAVRDYLNLHYYYEDYEREWFNYESESEDSVSVAGYEFLKPLSYYRYNDQDSLFNWNGNDFLFSIYASDTLVFELQDVAAFVKADSVVAELSAVSISKKAKLVIHELSFSKMDSTELEMESIRGYLLLKKK